MPAQFTLRSMTALAWVSPTSLAVLGREAGDDTQPFEIAIDGSSIIAASGAAAAGSDRPWRPAPNVDAPVVVGDNSGQIFVQTPDCAGCSSAATTQLRAPVYPG